MSRHFCSFFLLCVRQLFGRRRISTGGKLAFHLWKVYFPLVEKEFSTGGNLLLFNECPFETSNDMTGNSTCASPTIALLPVYAPCAPRCAV